MTISVQSSSVISSKNQSAGVGEGWRGLFILMFFVTLLLPFTVNIGTLRLSPSRVYLLLALIPCVIAWLSGKAGRIQSCDIYIIAYGCWAALALGINDGFSESTEPIGILLIETLGAYFLARCTITNEATFRKFAQCYSFTVILLLPFALLESATQTPVLLDIASKIGPTVTPVYPDPRFGLRRAQALFEHPILFGMFSAAALSISFYTLTKSAKLARALVRALLISITAFLSLSSGALLVVSVQYIQIGWDYLTRNIRRRWLILTLIVLVLYVLIDSLSSRTPFQVFVSYLTFSAGSGYTRLLIWKFGTEQVWNTPWFGIGLSGDWERPSWLGSSIDNFWLLTAVRYGFPAFILLAIAVVKIIRRAGLARLDKESLINCRKGWIFSIVGTVAGICTVHLWNSAYVFFMFMLGSGAWFATMNVQPKIPVNMKSATLCNTKKVMNDG